MIDKRWITVLCTNLILLLVVGMANDTLSNASIYIYLGGLHILFPALYMPVGPGLLMCFSIGLLMDTLNPHFFGISGIALSIPFTITAMLRQHLTFDSKKHLILISQIANVLSLLGSQCMYGFFSANLPSFLITLLSSQLILILISTFFIKFQFNTLQWFNLKYDINEEP